MLDGLHGARIFHGAGSANTLEIVVDLAVTPKDTADDAEDDGAAGMAGKGASIGSLHYPKLYRSLELQ
jgi:hypothetical protein